MFNVGDTVIIKREHCNRRTKGTACPETGRFGTPYCIGHKGIIKGVLDNGNLHVRFPILGDMTCIFSKCDILVETENEEFE